MRHLLLPALLLLTGCIEPAFITRPPTVVGGACPDWEESGELPLVDIEADVLYRGAIYLVEPDPAVQRIEDTESWDALVAGWGVTPSESVDFETHKVMAVHVAMSSTCGLAEERLLVVGHEGGLLVDLTVEDSSGACDAVCDAEGAYGVLVAVEKDTAVEGCARRLDVCAG